MTRLLFAAARGARIDIQGKDGNWYKASAAPIENKAGVQFRIHPLDAHLAYGPVSTTLRKSALNPWTTEGTWAVPHGMWWMDLSDWLCWDECKDELHRSLFLLILAEALADTGL